MVDRGIITGLTGLSSDLLHPISDLVAPLLSSLFSIYFYLDAVPSSWQRSLICPVPKKGDLSRISNYRPISLTEVTRKVYEMCILDRLKVDTPLSREQVVFANVAPPLIKSKPLILWLPFPTRLARRCTSSAPFSLPGVLEIFTRGIPVSIRILNNNNNNIFIDL